MADNKPVDNLIIKKERLRLFIFFSLDDKKLTDSAVYDAQTFGTLFDTASHKSLKALVTRLTKCGGDWWYSF